MEPVGSAAALQQVATPLDTAVVESPLPGGVAELTRFLLNTVPPWVQIAGVVAGGIAGAVAVGFLWRRRRALAAWIVARNRLEKIGLATAVFVVLAASAAFGGVSWHYTQHDNDFCVGCHVMNPAFHRFANPDNKHAELSCHDCHQQSILASARQMYLWVAERPDEIGEHAKVPNRVCETCHVTADTARWQRVASTAGHRVHFESDSSALAGLQCVTCHGVEVHRFRAVSETCGQSGCHDPEETNIQLGRMAVQAVRHCTSCHGFTADVPGLATRDSASGTLRPGHEQCLGCHEMRSVLTDFDARRDPHGGKCGSCHNPHTQATPAAAAASCASSGCHDNWRDEPFHTGSSHRAVGQQCLTCHLPHSARVDASDCQACHEAVRSRTNRRPPVRFDTAAALRRGDTATLHPHAATRAPQHGSLPSLHLSEGFVTHRGDPFANAAAHDTPFADDEAVPATYRAGRAPSQVVAAADSFPHARHERIACLVCHETGTGHGRLTFEPPRGCAICHHQAPAQLNCETCHRREEYTRPRERTLTVTVPDRQPRHRPVDFLHETHAARRCLECHTQSVTLAPPAAVCGSCHAEHHEPTRQCGVCHQLANPGAAHTSLEVAHQRCDACHTESTIARLTPTRSLCGTCHAGQRTNHHEPRECTVCHFLVEPSVYRARLTSPSRG